MAPRIATATDGEEDDRCRDLGAEDCDFGRFHGGVGLHGAAIACERGTALRGTKTPMLKRLYIDNYCTFQNFTWEPGKLNLLFGRNGSGKSSCLDVLVTLREFLGERCGVENVFPEASLTRWDTRQTQRIECDVEGPDGTFHYRLQIGRPGNVLAIASETLHVGTTQLFQFENGTMVFFDDSGKAGVNIHADSRRSGLARVVAGQANTKLMWFKSWVAAITQLALVPSAIPARTDREDRALVSDGANFSNFYRYLAQSSPETLDEARENLATIIDGFAGLSIGGIHEEDRVGFLRARFRGPNGNLFHLPFTQLSDGQRALVVLYVVLAAAKQGPAGGLLLLDEPENYVALEEIQPFLMDLVDCATGAGGPQVCVISHHPEYMNKLAPAHGHVFFREAGGPTRTRRFVRDTVLTAAEVVARGELEATP